MFKGLVPWKKRNQGKIAVRGDEPTREEFYPIARLREEFDSLMGRFFDDRWFSDRAFSSLPSLLDESSFNWNWDLGWEDKGKEYVYRAELPGFEPDDFDIKVSGNALTVRAEHKDEKKQKNGTSYRYGSFVRTFTLPHGADDSDIDARYHSGILEIHLPKSKDAQGKRIEVKSA